MAQARTPQRTVCPQCDSTWGGLSTSHCMTCHQTFTGPTGFDHHRQGQHASGHRHCVHPAQVKWGKASKRAGEPVFIDAGRSYPCWALSGEDSRWDTATG